MTTNLEHSKISPFLQQYNAVPPTPLLTSDVLKEENELWPDVQVRKRLYFSMIGNGV